MIRNVVVSAWLLALVVVVSPVGAYDKLGAGPYYNTKMQMVQRDSWNSGEQSPVILITMDNIETVNCAGCDTTSFYPGRLFNLRNRSKKPICVAMTILMKDESRWWADKVWGSGETFLIAGGKEVKRALGITVGFGWKSPYNLNFTSKLQTWEPVDRKTCGPNPYV